MKKVLVLLANGFEDIETFTFIDLLRRAKIKVDLVSINELTVKSGAGINIILDLKIKDISLDDYDLLFLPGGAGVKALDDSKEVKEAVLDFNKKGKLISAICAAPLILGKLGLLDSKNFTCYPSFEEFAKKGNYKEVGVVEDGNIITGRGIGFINEFSLHIIELLTSKEVKINIAKQTLINESKGCGDK